MTEENKNTEEQVEEQVAPTEEVAEAPVVEKEAVAEEVVTAKPEVDLGKYKDLVEKIEGMTVLELSELVKVLEVKFGVSAASFASAPAAGGGEAGAVEEKDSFDVELKSAGDQKIQVIKVVREATGLGLKESKELVDGAPKMIKQGLKKEEAEALKNKLIEAGGVAEMK